MSIETKNNNTTTTTTIWDKNNTHAHENVPNIELPNVALKKIP